MILHLGALLARALEGLGKFDEALAALSQLLELDPENQPAKDKQAELVEKAVGSDHELD